MTKPCSHQGSSFPERGRGTVSNLHLYSVENKYEKEEREEKKVIKKEGSRNGCLARPPSPRDAALLSNIRAGRALIEPEFKSRREQVRWRVRHLNLSALDRATRQDAARDAGLEWDEAGRTYRLRRKAAPPPPLPTGGSDG